MRSNANRFVDLLRRASDLCGVAIALSLAYLFRFGLGIFELPEGSVGVAQDHLLTPLPAALLLSGVAFQIAGLYRRPAPRGLLAEAALVFKGSVLAMLVLLAATFLYRGESYSRIMAATSALLLPLILLVLRLSLDSIEAALRRRGLGRRRALVVGGGSPMAALLTRLAADPRLGVEVVGRVPVGDEPDDAEGLPKTIASVNDLANALQEHDVEEVYLALPQTEKHRLRELDQILTGVPVDVRLVPDLAGCALIRPEISTLDDLPIITLRQGPHVGLNAVVKRGFDLLGSLALLLVTTPLMLLIGLAVKLTSPGRVLFRQERVGWGGRRFTILKFRTMRADAEAVGPTKTARDDPRRTAFGTFLRRTSLDELPQLWNVIRGDMSLVGPRPEPVGNYPQLEEQLPHFMLRHAVRAGMTGWAQVNGLRGDAAVDERLRFDLDYIRRWSLLFDLKILLLTLFRGFVHKNAF